MVEVDGSCWPGGKEDGVYGVKLEGADSGWLDHGYIASALDVYDFRA